MKEKTYLEKRLIEYEEEAKARKNKKILFGALVDKMIKNDKIKYKEYVKKYEEIDEMAYNEQITYEEFEREAGKVVG